MTSQRDKPQESRNPPAEKLVSLAPLDLEKALSGLLKVKTPEKAKKLKRKKAPPTPEKE